jgi:hypothetical protein
VSAPLGGADARRPHQALALRDVDDRNQAKAGVVSCHLWYRYRMPISSLDRDLAELAAAVRLDGILAALAGRAFVGDAYMLGMLVSGMTVYGRTTSPVDLFAGINEENAKVIARGRARGAESWSDRDIRKAIEDGDTTVTLADATVFPPGSPRYEVPLLRIRLAQVAGWWLVPTDAEGKASFTHPSAG